MTEANRRGILTIGIGDLGNEAGMGTIVDDVLELFPPFQRCNCPCGGRIATVVETEVTVVAICSNLGAYGITACVAALLGKPEILQGVDVEEQMIRACLRCGGMEGVQANPSLEIPVDMITKEAYLSILTLMKTAVKRSLTEIEFYRYPLEVERIHGVKPDWIK